MELGKYSYGTQNIAVFSWGEPATIKIGAFCSIASKCEIFIGGNHHMDTITTYPFGMINTQTFSHPNVRMSPLTKGDVIIGNDVWIGHGVTIMSGVKIGDGAVIATNSHVVKDVPPYSIVGGNPAKVIRYRFTDDQIKDLLEVKWWEWQDSVINENLELICSDHIAELVLKSKQIKGY
jgi:acetyltransferase-like isoleucine patch superfamily enzyme